MHDDLTPFSIEIHPDEMTEEGWKEFNSVMNKINDEFVVYSEGVAKELNVPVGLALDIVYLRGRSRWSQELEDRVLRAYREKGVLNLSILAGEEEEELQKLGL